MATSDDDQLQFVTFVQLNDLYHIGFLMDPTDPNSFVLPRIATVLKRMRADHGDDRVIFCLPGDFLNPAWLSRTHHSRQMIDVLNQMGLSVATFGNHEFDFHETDFTPANLAERVSESRFEWVISNLVPSGQFGELVKSGTLDLKHIKKIPLSREHSIFLLGLMYKGTFAEVGNFSDPVEQCPRLIGEVKDASVDAEGFYKPARTSLVALTHQLLEDDSKLAAAFPDFRLIMGGHDHDVVKKTTGGKGCLIVKSLSNGRSLRLNFIGWIPRHVAAKLRRRGMSDMQIQEWAAQVSFRPVLTSALQPEAAARRGDTHAVEEYLREYQNKMIDPAGVTVHEFRDDGMVIVATTMLDTMHPAFAKLVEADPETDIVIRRWLDLSPEHKRPLTTVPVILDTDDDSCRTRSTNFGNFVADCFAGRNGPDGREQAIADVSLVNSGSFRLDRKILKGEVMSEMTLCDLLFHDNDLRVYSVSGSTLLTIIDASLKAKGSGEFLQVSGLEIVARVGSESSVESVTLVGSDGSRKGVDPVGTYRAATTLYLATKSKVYSGLFSGCRFERSIAESVRELLKQEIVTNGIRVAANEDRWVFKAL